MYGGVILCMARSGGVGQVKVRNFDMVVKGEYIHGYRPEITRNNR